MSKRLLALFAALAVVGIIVAFKTASKQQNVSTSTPAVAAAPEPAAPAVTPVSKTDVPAVTQAKKIIPAAPVQATTNAPLSDEQRLVAEMYEICSGKGPITAEQAEKFKKNLEELIRRGGASANAIREFLEKNVDADFGQIAGGDQLSYASMRSAMIDALKQIGGPEAQAVMVQTLQTSAVPGELLQLANNLDSQAPGVYREQILRAAREALEMAAANQLGTNAEIGPAYRILNTYGEAGTAESMPERDPGTFFNVLSTASQPDGKGLPDLLKIAGDANPEASGKILATEMIAQLAGQSSQALDALTQMAQNNQISNRVWTRLAPILGGDEYQLSPESQGPGSPDTRSYSVVNTIDTPEKISQRIDLIDHFLTMVDPNSSAAFALLNTRNSLASRLSN